MKSKGNRPHLQKAKLPLLQTNGSSWFSLPVHQFVIDLFLIDIELTQISNNKETKDFSKTIKRLTSKQNFKRENINQIRPWYLGLENPQ